MKKKIWKISKNIETTGKKRNPSLVEKDSIKYKTKEDHFVLSMNSEYSSLSKKQKTNLIIFDNLEINVFYFL